MNVSIPAELVPLIVERLADPEFRTRSKLIATLQEAVEAPKPATPSASIFREALATSAPITSANTRTNTPVPPQSS